MKHRRVSTDIILRVCVWRDLGGPSVSRCLLCALNGSQFTARVRHERCLFTGHGSAPVCAALWPRLSGPGRVRELIPPTSQHKTVQSRLYDDVNGLTAVYGHLVMVGETVNWAVTCCPSYSSTRHGALVVSCLVFCSVAAFSATIYACLCCLLCNWSLNIHFLFGIALSLRITISSDRQVAIKQN